MTMTASLEEITPDISGASRVRATMQLDFARDADSGNTYLATNSHEPPLKVVRSFALEDGSALAHVHNVSGGLLGGDHLTVKINVGHAACAQLTTTGATRIYRHRKEFSPTTQYNQFLVGEGAFLEYLPDATIPFAGANFLQRTSIELAEGAGVFWWEIVAPGREASGELFEYDRFEARSCVGALGRRIAAESICLRPAKKNISSLARLGPYRYTATFYICRVGLDASAWRAAENHLRDLTDRLSQRGEILVGISSLVAHGLVVKCLARRGHEVLPALQAVWRSAKHQLYGREAIPPRKVN